MAIFNPEDHKDEFTVPEGQYELYFSSQEIKYGKDSGVPYLNMTATFVDGPGQGKGFSHIFAIFNPDSAKRKKAESWFANFCRAVDLGPFDPESEGEKMLNKTFIGDVKIEQSEGFQPKNTLLPWGFHRVDGASNSPKPSKSAPQSSGVSSGLRPHESDPIPF